MLGLRMVGVMAVKLQFIYYSVYLTIRWFYLNLLKAKTKVRQCRVRYPLYAGDAGLTAHSEADLQTILNKSAYTSATFGFAMNSHKPELLYEPAPYVNPCITVG